MAASLLLSTTRRAFKVGRRVNTAINLGAQNLFGGPPGLGVSAFGVRLGFGEGRRGDPLAGGPQGLIGDTVRVRGRQRGFLILERQGGKLTFVKTSRRSRQRRSGGGGGANKTFDRALQIAMIKAMLK